MSIKISCSSVHQTMLVSVIKPEGSLLCIPHLVEQCQLKAMELFRVELHGQRRSLSCEALQLLDEVPALGQRYASPPPTHLDAGLWRKLLTDRGNQPVILDF